jgi:glutamate synthase domain-containing protein 3
MPETLLDCAKLPIREINQGIRKAMPKGGNILLKNPHGMHNLAVGLVGQAQVTVDGSAGYYCAGLIDGPTVRVEGNAGWGLAEGMMKGSVTVEGNAGNSAAASIRGGEVVVKGNAGARAGIAMKGGLCLIGGDCGMMAGFLMQKGVLIVCGDAGPSVASSMYEGTVYVGGKAEDLGADTKVEKPSAVESRFLQETLARHGLKSPKAFRKIVSARTLWNFKSHEFALWKDVL